VRVVDLKASRRLSGFAALVRYLRRQRPQVLKPELLQSGDPSNEVQGAQKKTPAAGSGRRFLTAFLNCSVSGLLGAPSFGRQSTKSEDAAD
jgi:hypothetical protein